VEAVEAVAALTVAREATLLETALRFNSMMFFSLVLLVCRLALAFCYSHSLLSVAFRTLAYG
jgi:hypothetical protein